MPYAEIFTYMTPYGSSTIFGYPMIHSLNYMKTNKNRSDFADAHTDLSTNAVTPLQYLTMNSYRHMYLYVCRLAEYADRQSSGKK